MNSVKQSTPATKLHHAAPPRRAHNGRIRRRHVLAAAVTTLLPGCLHETQYRLDPGVALRYLRVAPDQRPNSAVPAIRVADGARVFVRSSAIHLYIDPNGSAGDRRWIAHTETRGNSALGGSGLAALLTGLIAIPAGTSTALSPASLCFQCTSDPGLDIGASVTALGVNKVLGDLFMMLKAWWPGQNDEVEPHERGTTYIDPSR